MYHVLQSVDVDDEVVGDGPEGGGVGDAEGVDTVEFFEDVGVGGMGGEDFGAFGVEGYFGDLTGVDADEVVAVEVSFEEGAGGGAGFADDALCFEFACGAEDVPCGVDLFGLGVYFGGGGAHLRCECGCGVGECGDGEVLGGDGLVAVGELLVEGDDLGCEAFVFGGEIGELFFEFVDAEGAVFKAFGHVGYFAVVVADDVGYGVDAVVDVLCGVLLDAFGLGLCEDAFDLFYFVEVLGDVGECLEVAVDFGFELCVCDNE